MKYYTVCFSVLILLFTACSDPEESEVDVEDTIEDALSSRVEFSDEQLAFWDRIQEHCGNAYEGILADATPYYQTFDADQIRIHVRNCTDDLTHISLHIDDDHSRNLLITKTDGNLLLKHDHRNEDGTEEEITQYGGFAEQPGLATRQIFWADTHTAEILPERFDNFWFVDLMDDQTLAYGVHWPIQGNSIRMEFDISEPVEPPPAPWGY
ncbi:hypothetical protein DYD21_18915 [Rhodohalobacter sp. SW132]|uniref:hypothetical protein n=1 Tax=Rhodohalobacter sp. SW132 TaxID=2293433 RepID=UPI000E237564|nr:hypothetical protein [Rhodohalobacter sp. SW132]REL24282.1 hypothetical protein DYD21_18915 [Rhodohalobacter sp. SW132]